MQYLVRLFFYVMGALASAALLVATSLFVSFLFALPTYLLWNALVPELFALKAITWFQAWMLNFLCALLFKGSSSK